MSSKQKIIVSFAEKVGVMDVDYMAETAHRMNAQPSLISYPKKSRDTVIKLSRAKNVELMESPDPHQEIKNSHERFNKDTYEVIVKELEDMGATMMDVG